ncbi:MAG: hypothetical protein PHH28_09785 [Desulfuromonadaceae bacterium]|nr:hypothetical protein [Desulfuromonadaceae bacterium]
MHEQYINFDRVLIRQEILEFNYSSDRANIKTSKSKSWIFVSKAETHRAHETILSLVNKHPSWGPKKIADSLMVEGISLSGQSIHKFFVRRNINHFSQRTPWENKGKGAKL